MSDLHFVYRDPGREEPLELRVEWLRGDLEASGLFDVSAEGSVGGTPVDLRGSIGPMEEAVHGRQGRTPAVGPFW